jgi:hypothetical protein
MRFEQLTYTLIFTDGTTMSEPDVLDAGGFTLCTQRSGFDSFVVHVSDSNEPPVSQVVIRDDMRPIFGRLWVSTVDSETGKELGQRLRAVVYGWQKTVHGTNVKCLSWATSNGIYLSDRSLDDF